jgi:hypothetical protein
MDFHHSVITLTFGDAAENHVGMEMIGTRGKAVGSDWKHSSKWTLRHAAGAHAT